MVLSSQVFRFHFLARTDCIDRTKMYRGSAKYTRVPTQEDSPRVSRGSAFSPSQFKLKEEAVPWKAVGLAALLFVLGAVLLAAGCLIHTGHVENEVYGDRYTVYTLVQKMKIFTTFKTAYPEEKAKCLDVVCLDSSTLKN